MKVLNDLFSFIIIFFFLKKKKFNKRTKNKQQREGNYFVLKWLVVKQTKDKEKKI